MEIGMLGNYLRGLQIMGNYQARKRMPNFALSVVYLFTWPLLRILGGCPFDHLKGRVAEDVEEIRWNALLFFLSHAHTTFSHVPMGASCFLGNPFTFAQNHPSSG